MTVRMQIFSTVTGLARRGLGLIWRAVPADAKRMYADWRVGATRLEKHSYNISDGVMLTFDDFGNEEQVKQLLRILRQYDAAAMFFLVGDWADSHPELVSAILTGGHVIGNHTYSHRDLLGLSDAEVRDEIRRGPQSEWFRPPRGRYNQRIRSIAQELGLKICYWTIDSDDWQGVSKQYIVRKVLAQVKPGAVILMHIHGEHTLEALPEVIAGIRQRGLRLWKPEGVRA